MSTTIAEQFVEVLRQAGVARVYGVVGDSLNPIVDAIRRTPEIEWVHVRNEEAAAFADAAEAQLNASQSADQILIPTELPEQPWRQARRADLDRVEDRLRLLSRLSRHSRTLARFVADASVSDEARAKDENQGRRGFRSAAEHITDAVGQRLEGKDPAPFLRAAGAARRPSGSRLERGTRRVGCRPNWDTWLPSSVRMRTRQCCSNLRSLEKESSRRTLKCDARR